MPAPGRYCLATCYCGECPHYAPIQRHRDTLTVVVAPTAPIAPARTAWTEREEGSSWLDKM